MQRSCRKKCFFVVFWKRHLHFCISSCKKRIFFCKKYHLNGFHHVVPPGICDWVLREKKWELRWSGPLPPCKPVRDELSWAKKLFFFECHLHHRFLDFHFCVFLCILLVRDDSSVRVSRFYKKVKNCFRGNSGFETVLFAEKMCFFTR